MNSINYITLALFIALAVSRTEEWRLFGRESRIFSDELDRRLAAWGTLIIRVVTLVAWLALGVTAEAWLGGRIVSPAEIDQMLTMLLTYALIDGMNGREYLFGKGGDRP
ncbi:hypothetical protein [Denitromonas halophila]|uniref:Uncharacterized protein n=1 Tax=Denitromonas halophila TaxID=1629404 RepID=A0A557QXA8_9RHOO|nr:hypothetical protein [Denitromonas halophila]TVO57554.1 hypothetical protein FHP91_07710 [Denitromonas halophila]